MTDSADIITVEKFKSAAKKSTPPKTGIFAAPYAWRDPSTIPPRDWLYGRHYIKGFVTATISASGIGKSSLALQLLLWEMSESMGNHDSEVVDASSVD